MPGADIIVIGAGPVGMLAALIAVKAGLSVLILERKLERDRNPRAVGITPPALEIMRPLGIDRRLINLGVAVRNSRVGGSVVELGRSDFSCFKSDYKFILSIPQDRTEAALEDAVLSCTGAVFMRGFDASGIKNGISGVEVTGKNSEGDDFIFSAAYVLACDGSKSAIRTALGIKFQGAPYRETFLMGDFEDNSGWKDEGRLYMTSRGSLESFPLPEGRRRYVLRTPLFIKEYTSDYLEREIPRRCGIDVSKAARFWESGFGVQHYLAEKFCSGRVFLCGDAAHVMSPTGGQNMNTGFADAELAVYLIQRSITGPKNIKQISLVYESLRKKAARSASWRAGFLMKFGTSGGIIWNALRFLLSFIILHSPIKRILIPVLGMMTIPNRNLNSCRNRVERLIGV